MDPTWRCTFYWTWSNFMLVLPGGYLILPRFLVTTKASKAAANIPSAIRRNTFWLLWPLCFWIWWVTQHPSIWNPLPWPQGGPGLLDRWEWVSSPNLDPIIENLRIINTPNATPKPGNRGLSIINHHCPSPNKAWKFLGGGWHWGGG